ncbi:RagB/SusD family nutrient uptake outer membrane protein [Pedobacter rhizosphaerae]|uniref:SusD family protein n=1 Tax=Pedobacter rhizosphaerae TaxID=390241 RepID=A0A1H9IML2_9SPHI|nr:RagB/SusD family nutrient uptake outer membrane protein [Pedobacter rhizosphaerae]SEQ75635.1 SusD family protein [Pedobacter rhizosphaerae]
MKKILIFAVLLVVLIAPSCKKEYLQTQPTNQVSLEEIFSTTTNATSVLNGIYSYMFTRTTATTTNVQGKPGVGGILLGIDFMGEDLHQAAATWFTSTGEGNYVAPRNDTHPSNTYYYRTFYRMINNANYLLEYIDAATGSDADKNRIKAEAYTIRAYAYSYLVQFYGTRYIAGAPNNQLGVPLVLKVADVAMPRVSVEQVYAQIISDLDKAIALNLTTKVNKTHADVWVAKGLRARVALTMQDYPNAIKYAKEVIDGGRYPLMSQADYQIGFNNNTLSEFMWCAMPTTEQGDTFGSFYAQIAYNANTTYMRGTPKMINKALYDQIGANDVRKKMWEPSPTAANFPLPTTAFTRRAYMSRKFSVKTVGDPSLGDVPWMRSAEMHLILAEAYARSGQTALAQSALFALVSKRDLTAVQSTKTGTALTDEIMINRRVELWGEGFRYLDLKRLNLPLDRSTANVPNYVSASVSEVVSIPAGDPRFLFLIPRDELNANPNIGPQNP